MYLEYVIPTESSKRHDIEETARNVRSDAHLPFPERISGGVTSEKENTWQQAHQPVSKWVLRCIWSVAAALTHVVSAGVLVGEKITIVQQLLSPHSSQPPPQQQRQQQPVFGKHSVWREREQLVQKKSTLQYFWVSTRADYRLSLCPRSEQESRVRGFIDWLPTVSGFMMGLCFTKSCPTAVSLTRLLGEGSRALTSLPVGAPHKHSIVCENVHGLRGLCTSGSCY